jgi:hypothetical protein
MNKRILIGAAAAMALLTAVYEAPSTAQAPALAGPIQVRAPAMLAGSEALSGPQSAAISGPDPLGIREAHSDGGYWYWEERRPK